MKWNSVRTRLTLWNVGVLALVLAGFGAVLSYSVRAWLTASVDRDLVARARPIAENWGRPAPPPPPDGPRLEGPPGARPSLYGRPPGPPPGGPPGGGPRGGGPPGPPPPPGGGQPPPGSYGYFHRPRLLSASGGSLDEFSPAEPWDPQAFRRAAAGETLFSTTLAKGERVRVLSRPLWRAAQVEGVIQVAYPLGEQDRLYGGLARALLTLIPLALLAAGIGGAFLTGKALQPVRRVTQAAAEIGAQDLSRRLEVKGEDEFSELALTFNGMVGRLEEAFRQLEAANERQRRFAGDASHELRTPLTAIKANTSLALSGERPAAQYREALEAVDGATDTMIRLVQDLLLLARSDAGRLALQREPLKLDGVLRRAVASLPASPGAPVTLHLPERPVEVWGDEPLLVRLIANLLENARRHTPEEGRIMVSAWPAEDRVTVVVQDTGEGIPPEHLPHIRERFYRVDAARARTGYGGGGGTGLGLSICQSIIEAHGGAWEIRSEVGRGTAISISLPAVTAPALSSPQETMPTLMPGQPLSSRE